MLRNYRKSKRSLSLKIYQHVKRTSITESNESCERYQSISYLRVKCQQYWNAQLLYFHALLLKIYEYFHNNRRGEEEGWYIFKGRHSASHDPFRRTKNGTASARWWKKKRKKERKKKVHPWPSTDFNFVVRKERTSRIVSTLPVNNVPSECGRRGRRRRRAKSHGPFFPRLYIPRPESLSVSLVLPLFIARARGCHTALHNTDKSRCVRSLLSQQCIDWLRGCSRKIVVKNRG